MYKNNGLSSVLLIVLIFLVIFGLGSVYFISSNQRTIDKRQTTFQTAKEKTETDDALIYENKTYKYTVKIPGNWSINAPGNLENSPNIYFYDKDDLGPGASRLMIAVVDNSGGFNFPEFCRAHSASDGTDYKGLLCIPEDLKASKTTINGIAWEEIEDNSVGFVPSGFVTHAINKEMQMYLIASPGATKEQILAILNSFQFTY